MLQLRRLPEVTYQLQNTGAEVFLVHPTLIGVALQAAENTGLPLNRIFLLDQEPYPPIQQLYDFRTILAPVKDAQTWKWKSLIENQARDTTAVLNYSSGYVPQTQCPAPLPYY